VQARRRGRRGGVLLKSASTQELLNAIHAAQRGQRLFTQGKGSAPQANGAGAELGSDLTPRERELLALMACGLGNQEIAARLAIAMPTVKFHVTHVLAKLHAENRTDAVLIALRHGIVGCNEAIPTLGMATQTVTCLMIAA